VNEAVEEYKSYIANQVLAHQITLAPLIAGVELDFDEFNLMVEVERLVI
jgi:hypothetical protein